MDDRVHHDFSPSKLALYSSCPAAYSESRRAGPQPPNHHMIRGTFLHDCVYRNAISIDGRQCANDELELVNKCQRVKAAFRKAHPNATIIEEVPVFLKDDDILSDEEIVTMGYPDWFAIDGNDLYVLDWKFGSRPVDSKDNLQLNVLAASIKQQYPVINTCYVAIFQPLLHDVCDLKFEQVDAGILETISNINLIKSECLKENPRYNPTPYNCSHCNGKSACYKCNNALVTVSKKDNILARLDDIKTPEAMGELLDMANIAEEVIDIIKKRALKMAEENNGRLANMYITCRRMNTQWRDRLGAFAKAKSILPESAINRIAYVSIGNIKDELIKVYGEEKGEEVFKEEFGDFITKEQCNPYLRSKKR